MYVESSASTTERWLRFWNEHLTILSLFADPVVQIIENYLPYIFQRA